MTSKNNSKKKKVPEIKMRLEYVDIKKVKPAIYNPRTITEEELRRLTYNIEFYGIVDPIIINDVTGNIVGGHQRIKAVKSLGMKQIPAVFVQVEKHKEMALNIALNNPNMQGKFEMSMLRDVIEIINTGEFPMDVTGFDESELESIMTFEYEPDDIENIDGFGESYNFIIKCEDESELEQIQALFKSTGQKIKASTFFELLASKEKNL